MPPAVPDIEMTSVCLFDIRGESVHSNTHDEIKSDIIVKLATKNVQFTDPLAQREGRDLKSALVRSLPTMLLYDDKGLKIFDSITYSPDYYLTNAEIDIFKRHADEMVTHVPNHSAMIELGCGAMRKTRFILESLTRLGKTVTYYAVDLSESSLRDSLLPLVQMFPNITFAGLWGTYDDSLKWVQSNLKENTRAYLWLGSSIGNLDRVQSAAFMEKACREGMMPSDLFFCGIDRRNDFETISLAYNDRAGLTRDFILNGLAVINSLFGKTLFDLELFEYVSIYNQVLGRHEAYLKSKVAQTVRVQDLVFDLEKDELINIEYSYKWSSQEVIELTNNAHLSNIGRWTDSSDRYDMWLFQKPVIDFFDSSHTLLPCLEDFETMWKTWDTIVDMIPNDVLKKPIELRLPYIFYIGHLPTFADIILSRALGIQTLEPKYFVNIFERGIDPDMDEPSICHPHSHVPETWPLLADILEYQSRVRTKIRDALEKQMSTRIKRVLNMVLEHDAQHIETFLYMLVQDAMVKPPRGVARPIFVNEKETLEPSQWTAISGGNVTIGMDDIEDNDDSQDPPAMFGWDQEKPSQSLFVSAFRVQNRPVTVGEYHDFLESQDWKAELMPASWRRSPESQESSGVVSVFGLVPFHFAWKWPVSVSCIQAQAYATFKGMRLPTEQELVYLFKSSKGGSHNIGFRSWVPTNVITSNQVTDIVGSGWEISSTVFGPLQGYTPSKVYPGFSADFFDGKHQVVLGGSWATVPRLSRPSFRNWYQSCYPFLFSKFRLVSIE